MANINPGTLKYMSFIFCICAILFACLYKRLDTILLGGGIALLSYGCKMDIATNVFISSLAVFLGTYLPFGSSSVSVIQGFSDQIIPSKSKNDIDNIELGDGDKAELATYLDRQKAAGIDTLSLAKDEAQWTSERIAKKRAAQAKINNDIYISYMAKQKAYLADGDSSVPDFCDSSMGKPSSDNMLRIYTADECAKISKKALQNGSSNAPSSIQLDGQCLWVGTDGYGGVELKDGTGPSFLCARQNTPDVPTTFADLQGKALQIKNSDFNLAAEDQGSYFSKNKRWHQSTPWAPMRGEKDGQSAPVPVPTPTYLTNGSPAAVGAGTAGTAGAAGAVATTTAGAPATVVPSVDDTPTGRMSRCMQDSWKDLTKSAKNRVKTFYVEGFQNMANMSTQAKYVNSEDPTVPAFCDSKMGKPSQDKLVRLYTTEECSKISKKAVKDRLSEVPAGITKGDQCVWYGVNGIGGVTLQDGTGPSFVCARQNIPEVAAKFSDLQGARLNNVGRNFDPESEDQAKYFKRNGYWHQAAPKTSTEGFHVEGFENPKSESKPKHIPPPDNAERKEMFELGKKYELPKETDDPEYHLDAGTTFLNAYKSLKPDQLSAMSKDTLELINTQKQLMSTLNTLKPLISDGKQMMDTFQNYFGGGSGGNLGDLTAMANKFSGQ